MKLEDSKGGEELKNGGEGVTDSSRRSQDKESRWGTHLNGQVLSSKVDV